MTCMSLPFLLLVSLSSIAGGALARNDKNNQGHTLRHREQSVVVLRKPVEPAVAVEAPTPSPYLQVNLPPADATEEDVLAGSMGSLLKTEQEVLDTKSAKGRLQRKLVALIWLERVLQRNLDSMEEEEYREKISKSKADLEKDSTPETAEMLSKMRTEMHEFSVPFFRKAVKDELKDVRERQKVLLDQIMAIDEGQSPESLSETKDGAKDAKKDKKGDAKKKDAPKTEEEIQAEKEAKEARRAQGNMFVFLMVLLGGTLVCVLIGIAVKVNMHVSRTNRG